MLVSKDPGKKHFYISLVKSMIRMCAAGAFIMVYFTNPLVPWLDGIDPQAELIMLGGILLLIAEGLGILEEIA